MSRNFPIAGQLSITDRAYLQNVSAAALVVFRTKFAPATGATEPYLTGRYVTLPAAYDEIVTLAEIECVNENRICVQSWIDISDGSYAGDSLDEILNPEYGSDDQE